MAEPLPPWPAAYTNVGDFEQAVLYQQQAVEKVEPQYGVNHQMRLMLYQSGKAYRLDMNLLYEVIDHIKKPEQ